MYYINAGVNIIQNTLALRESWWGNKMKMKDLGGKMKQKGEKGENCIKKVKGIKS